MFCKRPKCVCPSFNHVPQFGSNDFKCLCKHSYTEHDPVSKKCAKGLCGCNRFNSTWSCSCGAKYNEHTTIFETREERLIMGKPVDDMARLEGDLNVPYMPGCGEVAIVGQEDLRVSRHWPMAPIGMRHTSINLGRSKKLSGRQANNA